MKCTSCGQLIRPVVAIDIDGTLADYHTHFLTFAEQYMGVAPEVAVGEEGGLEYTYEGQCRFKEWFCEIYETDERTWNDIKLAYRQGGMKRSAPVYDGAGQLTGKCKAAGAEVWLTTTRPYLRLDGVDPDTRFWLARHRITYDGLLYDEDKYRVLAQRVDPERVVMVLDDLPEMVEAAVAEFGQHVAVLAQTHYNGRATAVGGEQVQHLPAAATVATNRIRSWKEEHDPHGN